MRQGRPVEREGERKVVADLEPREEKEALSRYTRTGQKGGGGGGKGEKPSPTLVVHSLTKGEPLSFRQSGERGEEDKKHQAQDCPP